MRITLITFLLLTYFCSTSILNAQSRVDVSLQKEIEHSIIQGLKWLYIQQKENGSWNNYPAITALVLSSYLRAHPNFGTEDTLISKGFNFLKACVQKDGGIYLDDMKSYNTAICLMAFEDAKLLEYEPIIINAKKYLMGLQFDEINGYTSDSVYFGGLSYGKDDKAPDLSNLQWALEALRDKEYKEIELMNNDNKQFERKRTLFYTNAIEFLERTQNYQKTNDQPYAANDGGFMYRPGESKAGDTKSYGGMTYAGLKSYIHARLTKGDERVMAAFNWIRNNFSVTENPGLGEQGLYYYYHTMAKALNIYGDEIIYDENNIARNWREELANQLLKTQTTEGYWVNQNARWWENDPVLVTAYCILTLEELIN
jgi:squalene-hopene/tetraprenyl-beta-curcumene cyclase